MNLKSCPFCNGRAVIYFTDMGYEASCRQCGATGESFKLPSYSTKNRVDLRLQFRAARAWNRRWPEKK